MRILLRALGALADAAWLRRQFTRDNEWRHSARLALRQSRRHPGPFLTATLMLALGIGTAAASLSLLDRLVLRALPFPDPEALVSIHQHNHATGNRREEVAPGNYLDWEAAASSFAAMAAAAPFSVDVRMGQRPEVVYASQVTTRFFDVLQVAAWRGRLFDPSDFAPGAPPVMVVSHPFWLRLGGESFAVGSPLVVDNVPATVVGVLAPGVDLDLFDGAQPRDVWLAKQVQPYERNIRGEGWWAVIARLKPGTTVALAQADLDVIAQRLSLDHPRTNARTTVAVSPLRTPGTVAIAPALQALLAAAALILLVTCANVAHLALLQALARHEEFQIRRALGAGGRHLLVQVGVESAFLAAVSTLLALPVAWLTIRTVRALMPSSVRALEVMTLDGTVLAATVGVGAVTAVLAGVVPLWHVLTQHAQRSNGTSRSATASRRTRTVRHSLVAAEIALAAMLATGVGLLARSFVSAAGQDTGFDGRRTGVVQVFAHDSLNSPSALRTFHRRVTERVAALPGVEQVGTVSAMPLIDANINILTSFVIEGRPASPDQAPTAFVTVASEGYFPAIGTRLRQGRLFESFDREDSQPVAVISASLAGRHWPNRDAVGAWISLRVRNQVQRRQIVGVIDDMRHDALELPTREEVFVPFAQSPFGSMTFVFSARTEPGPLVAQVRDAIWAVVPDQTIYDEGTIESLITTALAPRRFTLTLAAGFAVFALLLAAVGVYTGVAFSMAQQAREFSIKVALGASRQRIVSDGLGQAVRLALVGVATGLVGSLLAGRWLEALLFSVSTFDPATYTAVAISLLMVSLLAAAGPVRHAMRADPTHALRR